MKNWIKKLRNRTPLGLLQLKHDKTRLLTAVSGIVFADILIFMQLGFINALSESGVVLHRNLNSDLVILNPHAVHWSELSTFPRRRLYQAMDVPGVESTEGLYVNTVRWKNPQTKAKTSILVVGMNVDSPAFKLPDVNQHLEEIKLPDTFVFDRASRGEYAEAIAAQDQGELVTTEIERRTITIGGLFSLGASFGADATLIGSDQNFLRLFPRREPGTVSVGLVKLKPGADPTQVKNALNSHLSGVQDAEVMTVDEFVKKEQAYWTKNRPVGVIFTFGTIIGFIVGMVIVYQILSTDVNDHLSEYATFKAMGYRQSYLLGIILEEAIILALCGFFPGMAISMVLYNGARNATALPIYLTVVRAISVFLLTLIMCTVSGMIATRKLQSADPADIF